MDSSTKITREEAHVRIEKFVIASRKQERHKAVDLFFNCEDILMSLLALPALSRLEIFSSFCQRCGEVRPKCQCFRDTADVSYVIED